MFYTTSVLSRLFFIIAALFLAAQPVFADTPLKVFVSISPQKYFVQQIGKDLVSVRIMVQPGASPAVYEPKPRQMAALSETQVYFAIGVPFENVWLKKITAANPDMVVVNTDRGIEKRSMGVSHQHGEDRSADESGGVVHKDAGHPRSALDPHIWLSPRLVMVQIRSILTALQKLDPAHRSFYEDNYKAFLARLTTLDHELEETLKDKQGMQFMVFHPSWGYFAEAYGLQQVPIEIEGKNPKPAQLGSLIAHARARGIKVVFVQPQFSTRSANLVAREIGGRVAYADPLAADWLENLREVARQFQSELR